jgi:hypothetical protein
MHGIPVHTQVDRGHHGLRSAVGRHAVEDRRTARARTVCISRTGSHIAPASGVFATVSNRYRLHGCHAGISIRCPPSSYRDDERGNNVPSAV